MISPVRGLLSLFLAVTLILIPIARAELECYVCDNCDEVNQNTERMQCSTIIPTSTTTNASTAETTTANTTTSDTTTASTGGCSCHNHTTTETTPSATTNTINTTTPATDTDSDDIEVRSLNLQPIVKHVPHQRFLRSVGQTRETTYRCVKAVYEDGDVTKTKRGCIDVQPEDEDETMCQRSVDGKKVVACGVCNSNLCNPAARALVSSVALLLPVLAALVFLH